MKILHRLNHRLGEIVQWPYYFVSLALLAFVDIFIVIIPLDGLVVTSVLAKPKRWPIVSLSTIVGSTLGALLLAWVVQKFGMVAIEKFFPALQTSSAWIQATALSKKYGPYALIFTSATPLAQQPMIVLLALTHLPLLPLGLLYFVGRVIKYLTLGWLTAKAPQLLKKIRPLRKQIEDILRD